MHTIDDWTPTGSEAGATDQQGPSNYARHRQELALLGELAWLTPIAETESGLSRSSCSQPQWPLGDAVNEIGIDRRHTKLRLPV